MRMLIVFLILVGMNSNLLFAQQMESSVSSEAVTSEDNAVVWEEADVAIEAVPTRDPFSSGLEDGNNQKSVATSTGGNSAAELVLEGLAIKGEKASAIINGRTYHKGESPRNGIEVLEVRKGEADIRWGGLKKTLRFQPKKKELKKRSVSSPAMGPSGVSQAGYPDMGSAAPISGYNPAPMEDSK